MKGVGVLWWGVLTVLCTSGVKSDLINCLNNPIGLKLYPAYDIVIEESRTLHDAIICSRPPLFASDDNLTPQPQIDIVSSTTSPSNTSDDSPPNTNQSLKVSQGDFPGRDLPKAPDLLARLGENPALGFRVLFNDGDMVSLLNMTNRINDTHVELRLPMLSMRYNWSYLQCYVRDVEDEQLCMANLIGIKKRVSVSILTAEVYNWEQLVFTYNTTYQNECVPYYRTNKNMTGSRCPVIEEVSSSDAGWVIMKCSIAGIISMLAGDSQVHINVTCSVPHLHMSYDHYEQRIYNAYSIVRPGRVGKLTLQEKYMMILFRSPAPTQPLLYSILLQCPDRNFTHENETSPSLYRIMTSEIRYSISMAPAYACCTVSVRCRSHCSKSWSDWSNKTFTTPEKTPVSAPHVSAGLFDVISEGEGRRSVVLYYQPMTDSEARGDVNMYKLFSIDNSEKPVLKKSLEFPPPVRYIPQMTHQERKCGERKSVVGITAPHYRNVSNLSESHSVTFAITARTAEGYNTSDSLHLKVIQVPPSEKLLEIEGPTVLLNGSSQAVLYWTISDESLHYTAVWCLTKLSTAATATEAADNSTAQATSSGLVCKSVLMWQKLTNDMLVADLTDSDKHRRRRSLNDLTNDMMDTDLIDSNSRHRRRRSLTGRHVSYSITLPEWNVSNSQYMFALTAEHHKHSDVQISGLRWSNRTFCYNQAPEKPTLNVLKNDASDVVVGMIFNGQISNCPAPIVKVILHWSPARIPAEEDEQTTGVVSGMKEFTYPDFLSPNLHTPLSVDSLDSDQDYNIRVSVVTMSGQSSSSEDLVIRTVGPWLRTAHIVAMVIASLLVLILVICGIYACWRAYRRYWKRFTKLGINLPECDTRPEIVEHVEYDQCCLNYPNCTHEDELKVGLFHTNAVVPVLSDKESAQLLGGSNRYANERQRLAAPGVSTYPQLLHPPLSISANPSGVPLFIEMNDVSFNDDQSHSAVLPPANEGREFILQGIPQPIRGRDTRGQRLPQPIEGFEDGNEFRERNNMRDESPTYANGRHTSLPNLNNRIQKNVCLNDNPEVSSLSDVSEQTRSNASSVGELHILPNIKINLPGRKSSKGSSNKRDSPIMTLSQSIDSIGVCSLVSPEHNARENRLEEERIEQKLGGVSGWKEPAMPHGARIDPEAADNADRKVKNRFSGHILPEINGNDEPLEDDCGIMNGKLSKNVEVVIPMNMEEEKQDLLEDDLEKCGKLGEYQAENCGAGISKFNRKGDKMLNDSLGKILAQDVPGIIPPVELLSYNVESSFLPPSASGKMIDNPSSGLLFLPETKRKNGKRGKEDNIYVKGGRMEENFGFEIPDDEMDEEEELIPRSGHWISPAVDFNGVGITGNNVKSDDVNLGEKVKTRRTSGNQSANGGSRKNSTGQEVLPCVGIVSEIILPSVCSEKICEPGQKSEHDNLPIKHSNQSQKRVSHDSQSRDPIKHPSPKHMSSNRDAPVHNDSEINISLNKNSPEHLSIKNCQPINATTILNADPISPAQMSIKRSDQSDNSDGYCRSDNMSRSSDQEEEREEPVSDSEMIDNLDSASNQFCNEMIPNVSCTRVESSENISNILEPVDTKAPSSDQSRKSSCGGLIQGNIATDSSAVADFVPTNLGYSAKNNVSNMCVPSTNLSTQKTSNQQGNSEIFNVEGSHLLPPVDSGASLDSNLTHSERPSVLTPMGLAAEHWLNKDGNILESCMLGNDGKILGSSFQNDGLTDCNDQSPASGSSGVVSDEYSKSDLLRDSSHDLDTYSLSDLARNAEHSNVDNYASCDLLKLKCNEYSQDGLDNSTELDLNANVDDDDFESGSREVIGSRMGTGTIRSSSGIGSDGYANTIQYSKSDPDS